MLSDFSRIQKLVVPIRMTACMYDQSKECRMFFYKLSYCHAAIYKFFLAFVVDNVF